MWLFRYQHMLQMGKEAKIPKLPLRSADAARVTLDQQMLDEAQRLYDDGRYVDAYHLTRQAGPMELWWGAKAQTFAFRLSSNIGASRLGKLMICRARREDPHHAATAVHFGYYLQGARGLIPCWRHCLASEEIAAEQPREISYLKGMRAVIAGTYRDFDTAWRLMKEALELEGTSPWLEMERASILLSAERRIEAFETIDNALAMKSWYRPAVQMRARILHMLGRVDEAIEFLTQGLEYIQCSPMVMQLMTLKREVDDHAGMELLADRFDQLAVAAGETERLWIMARRADLLALRGNFAKAADFADKVPGEYYEGLSRRMRLPGVMNVRKRLPTEFVLQKHNTCAPATLAAIAMFWKRPITMEQIVDAICYDGTYDHNERIWAHENGFAAREFTVTLEAARHIIDTGMPFVLHTVEIGSGHSQAVVGYDLLRETLLIQDPGEPHYREVEADEFLKTYRLNGPRGLALVPVEHTERLEALMLPDSDVYDIYHRLNKALAVYQRDEAQAALDELETGAPQHRLTLLARLSMANFDGDDVEKLHAVERLLEAFPDDPRLLRWRYEAIRTLSTRKQRLKLLQEATAQRVSHPTFHVSLIAELMDDARDWPTARSQVRRAHHLHPGDTGVLSALGTIMRRVENAPVDDWLVPYRFAASMADKVEANAEMWFSLARSQGRTEEALAWLRRRERDYGGKSPAPAMTLASALDSMCLPEAHEVLRGALSVHPGSGDLLLQLMRFEMRLGNASEAESLLERARGHCAPGQWLRAKASVKRRFADHTAEMAACREILGKEPLAIDAHTVYARDLAALSGPQAALEHVMTVAARFPHHHGLAQLHVQWLRETTPQKAVEELRRLITQHPQDAWSHREVALVLHDLGRSAEALEPARQAVAITPDLALSHAVLATVLAGAGKSTEARECFRKAIRLDVNQPGCFAGLIDQQNSTAGRREELQFIHAEMVRQVLNGATLHAYRGHAFRVLSREELLAELRVIHAARPDLWEAWSVLIDQLIDSGLQDEAMRLAQQSSQKFALLPGAWHDMAEVWRQCGKPDAALQCARYIVTLNPDWPNGWCLLAQYLDEAGKHDEAAETLRSACARLPLEGAVHHQLVALLYGMNHRDEAWQIAEKAVQSDPGANWAWGCLQNWARTMQRGDQLIALAEKLTRERPHEARSWDVLARLLPLQRVGELLQASDQTLALHPRFVDAYDYRMETLARLGRFDEAERVPDNSPWGEQEMPHPLQGRRAWLQAVRGNLPDAMRRMRSVLDQHRDYYWGWEMYALWAEQRADTTEWLRAAEEMIRLAPRQPGPYCVAAEAALHKGQRDKGIAYLRQALKADPRSPLAAQTLLGLYWQKREIDSLRQTAAAMPATGASGLIKRVYLMLAAAHRGEADKARVELDWLATQPDMLGPLLKTILDYFQTQRKADQFLDDALATAVAEDRIGPSFAILWVEKEVQKSHWQCWQQLAKWMPRLGERLDPAIAHYLNSIGAAGAAVPHVEQFIQRAGPDLRERGEIWGKVGYALASAAAWRSCVNWLMPDYQRDDAEAWALWNLTYSQRMLYNNDLAIKVSLHVVQKGVRDDTWPKHTSLAAFGLASVHHDYAAAEALLEREPAPPETDIEGRLHYILARALVRVGTLPAAEGKSFFKHFLTESKRLLKGRAITNQTRLEYEKAVESMQKQTGVRVWPWERAKTTDAATYNTRGDSAGGSRWMVIAAIVLLMNLVRHCGTSHDNHVPTWNPNHPPRLQYLVPPRPPLFQPMLPKPPTTLESFPTTLPPTLSPDDVQQFQRPVGPNPRFHLFNEK